MLSEEDQGLVLRYRENGDQLLSVALFSKSRGLFYPLLRKSKKGARPDLFDTARVKLTQARQGDLWFASSYQPIRRRSNLALSYQRLQIASRFAEIIRNNVQHLPDHVPIYDLCERFFDLVANEPAPDASFLKSLYLFAKMEGLPVREDWVDTLGTRSREELAEILRSPLASQPEDQNLFKSLITSLEEWLVAEAHFIIPR